MIHPASAGEERKQSWSSGIVIFHQEKGGRLVRKKADHIGGANRKAQLCGADQSSVPPPYLSKALSIKKACGKREELSH